MDKSEKTGKGINKFVDHVVKDMINNIIVEKDFIDFVMPYNYNFKTRTGIMIDCLKMKSGPNGIISPF